MDYLDLEIYLVLADNKWHTGIYVDKELAELHAAAIPGGVVFTAPIGSLESLSDFMDDLQFERELQEERKTVFH